MKARLVNVTLLAALALSVSATAATYPVDDSASQVLDSSLRMKWDSVAPQSVRGAGVSGVTTVLVRLDTDAWNGRQGRIYMTLPEQPIGQVTASWTTHGTLLPGALRSGERALVYAGPLRQGLIEDTLRLVIQADGQKLVRTEQLRFSFELDLETP